MPQSKIRSLQLNSSDFRIIVETALGAPLNITEPLSAGTALTLSGSPVQWTPITGGGTGVSGGDGITVTGGSPVTNPQVVAVDSTVARTDITTETFSFAGDVSLNLNDTSQAADEDIWRVGATGSSFVIATRTDADAAGTSAISITRTGTAVDDITMPSPLLLTSSGEASTSVALQITANNPTLVINKNNATAQQGVWDVTGGTDGQLIWRTRTDAFGAGATWLTVNRSGTTVGDIAFTGSRLLFNGVPVKVGSPDVGGATPTLQAVTDQGNTTTNNIIVDAGSPQAPNFLALNDTAGVSYGLIANGSLRVNQTSSTGVVENAWISATRNAGVALFYNGTNHFYTVLDGAQLNGQLTMAERTKAGPDVAGLGKIWVKSGSPNRLYYTGDTGVDIDLTASLTASTGADNRIAVFTTATNVEGDANFTWDSSTSTLALGGGATNATISLVGSPTTNAASIQMGGGQQGSENLLIRPPDNGPLWVTRRFGSPVFGGNIHTSTTNPAMRIGHGSPTSTDWVATLAVLDTYSPGIVLRNTSNQTEWAAYSGSNLQMKWETSNFVTINTDDPLTAGVNKTIISILPNDIDTGAKGPQIQFQQSTLADISYDTHTQTASTGTLTVASGNAVIVFLTPTAANVDVRGVTANSTTDLGRVQTFINITAGPGSPAITDTITFKHEDTGATAAARMLLPGKGDVVLRAHDAIELVYNTNLTRWVCMSTTGVQQSGSPIT